MLRSACVELGVGLVEDTEARCHDGHRHAEFVIRLSGPYDIVVDAIADGSYRLIAPLHGGFVEREVGKDFGRLRQLYAVHKTGKEARQRRFSIQRRPLADGGIQLLIATGSKNPWPAGDRTDAADVGRSDRFGSQCVIRFDAQGIGHCLYTELIPLQSIGLLNLKRASLIEFSESSQQWEVRRPDGSLLFRSPSQQFCRDWEDAHFAT